MHPWSAPILKTHGWVLPGEVRQIEEPAGRAEHVARRLRHGGYLIHGVMKDYTANAKEPMNCKAMVEARLEVISKSQALLVEEVRNAIPKYESISGEIEIAKQNLKSTREAMSQLDRDALALRLVEIVVLQDGAAPSENTEKKRSPE
jgi:hypothetical protein